MPSGDGTGPAGLGPMTGRAAGYCAGYPVPGYMNPIAGRGWGGFGYGRGWGRGRGRGYGWGRGWFGYSPQYYAPQNWANPYGQELTPKEEASMLKEQAKAMQEEMKALNERIAELESAAKKSNKA